MRLPNNRIVVDLSKVQYAHFFYINQDGDCRYKMPTALTVHNKEVPINTLAPAHPYYPGETMVDRAMRLCIFDMWKAMLVLQLTANHSLTYTGSKAIELNKVWNAKIFKKKKD